MGRVAIVPLLAAIFKKKAKSDFLMPVSRFCIRLYQPITSSLNKTDAH